MSNDPSSATESCYACSATGVTREHVPPKCFFPEAKDLPSGTDLRRELITVPSCNAHNTAKAGEDLFLLYVLTINLSSNSVAMRHAFTKLGRTTQRRPALFSKLTESATPVARHARTGQAIDAVQVTFDEYGRFEQAMQLMARALHRHHFGINWPGPIAIVPDFVVWHGNELVDRTIADVVSLGRLLFARAQPYGANADVFTYHVADSPTEMRVMGLNFFEGTRVFALFGVDKTLAPR